MTKQLDAYLTVEAALVFPIVLVVQILTVYLFVFQYNRCLQNQDVGRLAVLGCGAQEQKKEELAKYLGGCSAALDLEKYVAWETETLEVELIQNKVCARGQGRLLLTAPDWYASGQKGGWTAEAEYELQRQQPVLIIRQYKKWQGGED